MSVVIRLMRAGAKKRPFYRMVVADSRRQRDGRFIEILGHYNPIADPYVLVISKEKAESWIAKGAQPSEQAASLLRTLGVTTPSKAPRKKVAAAAGTEKPKRAKKSARKKATAVSERKTKRKAYRASGKRKPAVKKAKKKS